MYVCVLVQVPLHKCRDPKRMVTVYHSSHFFEARSLTKPKAKLLASEPQWSVCLPFHCNYSYSYKRGYIGFQACTSTLTGRTFSPALTLNLLQSQKYFFEMCNKSKDIKSSEPVFFCKILGFLLSEFQWLL